MTVDECGPGAATVSSVPVARRIDRLGRVVIPVEVRRALAIDPGDELQVTVDGENVVLHKADRKCVFCGCPERLSVYRDRAVCATCREQLRA